MLDTSSAIRVATALGSIGPALEKTLLSSVVAGNTYWVDSTDTTKSDTTTCPGSFDQPFATLPYAISRCTASKGDVVFLKPGHAETTTAVAWSKAGVRVVGLGYGRNRPTLTATTAATDLINVTAANGQLINVRLVGAASGVTALIDGSTAADDFEVRNCEFVLAATPLNAMTWSGQRLIIEDLRVTQSANGADYIVVFEAGVDGFIFKRWNVLCPNGLDNALVNSGAFAHQGYIMDEIIAVGLDTLVVTFASSIGAFADGVMAGGTFVYSAAQTSIEDGVAAATSKGVAYGLEVQATDVTGKRAGRIPLATAS